MISRDTALTRIRDRQPGEPLDLRGADLREADLREANLSGIDLREADMDAGTVG